MLKKIKKYLLLIPLIMVLCFNVCVYGSVQAVDYSAYFHPWEECPYDFPFSPDEPTSILLYLPISSGTRDLYFYAVYMDSTDYDNYLNGLNYRLLVRVIDFYNPDAAYPTTKSENDYFIRFHGFKDNRLWSFSYDASTDSFSKTVSESPRSTIDLIYFKDSGQIRSVPADAPDSDYFNDGSSVGSHFFMQYTNYPGFDLVNFENESTLDVQVRFSPDLTDSLDRSFTDSEGNTYLRSDLSMRVNNFSNFPIQYTMVITSALVDVDNVFSYYSNDWVYSRSLDSYDDYYSDVAQKQQKSTFAHYVGSGQVDIVNFNFNQINLVQGGFILFVFTLGEMIAVMLRSLFFPLMIWLLSLIILIILLFMNLLFLYCNMMMLNMILLILLMVFYLITMVFLKSILTATMLLKRRTAKLIIQQKTFILIMIVGTISLLLITLYLLPLPVLLHF